MAALRSAQPSGPPTAAPEASAPGSGSPCKLPTPYSAARESRLAIARGTGEPRQTGGSSRETGGSSHQAGGTGDRGTRRAPFPRFIPVPHGGQQSTRERSRQKSERGKHWAG